MNANYNKNNYPRYGFMDQVMDNMMHVENACIRFISILSNLELKLKSVTVNLLLAPFHILCKIKIIIEFVIITML